MLYEDDLLMSLTGNVGRVGLVEKFLLPAALNQRVACIRVKDDKILDKKYIFQLFNSNYFEYQCIKSAQGIAQKNMSTEWLKEYSIPLPSIEEQRHIAATLDKANEMIALRKKQLLELDALAESVFFDLFGDPVKNEKGWEIRKLINICKNNDDIKCGPFGTQLNKSEYAKEGISLWGIPQINSFFRIPSTDYISEKKAEFLESYSIISGDIAMSRKGNVGKCAIYPLDFPKGIIHSDVLRIRFDNDIAEPTYMLYQFHISKYVEKQIDMVSSGAIMAGINVGKLKNIKMSLPPLALQTRFAAIIEKIEEQKAQVRKALQESEDLFQKLMQDLFRPN